jgi:CDP-4-dehydro-6-deoxyglucose reductase
MPVPLSFEVELAAARMIAPAVRELVFVRKDGLPFEFEAGQWVSLVLPTPSPQDGKPELRRSYSIASAPDGSPRFELAITHVAGGPGSSFLHTAPVGTELRVIGPAGFFTRPADKTGPSLFVATGTGVTPLRSMIIKAAAMGEDRPLWLLFGVRTEQDILYRSELDSLCAEHPNVRAYYTLSRGGVDWTGRRGYVQTHVAELWKELSTQGGVPHAYICGLQRMVGAVRDLLRKDMGVPREQVHSERYD